MRAPDDAALDALDDGAALDDGTALDAVEANEARNLADGRAEGTSGPQATPRRAADGAEETPGRGAHLSLVAQTDATGKTDVTGRISATGRTDDGPDARGAADAKDSPARTRARDAGPPAEAAPSLEAATSREAAPSWEAGPAEMDGEPLHDPRRVMGALARLAEERRDIALRVAFRRQLRLVALDATDPAAPVLALASDEPPARGLAASIAARIGEWTGMRWAVTIDPYGEGGPTLAELEASGRERLLAEAALEPGVAAVLAAFPGARVTQVRMPRDEAPGDEAPGIEPDDAHGDGSGARNGGNMAGDGPD